MADVPQYHLTYDSAQGDWELRRVGAERATRRFATKAEAVAGGALAEAIRAEGGSVRIHNRDGTIEEERTFPRAADPVGSPG